MAMNSFHKYISAIRKSKSFKPVAPNAPYNIGTKVVAMHKETRYSFGSTLIEELQTIIKKDSLVISSDWKTNEMYAYDFWLF